MKFSIALATTAAIFCGSANAKPCYQIAVQQYSRSTATLNAPFNSVKVFKKGRPPISCKFEMLVLYDHAMKISCQDGYKYEIGTTGYCFAPAGAVPDPNCEKAIVIAPQGTKTYHQNRINFKEESCIPGGAQLQIGTYIYGGGNPLIVTTHQFRAP